VLVIKRVEFLSNVVNKIGKRKYYKLNLNSPFVPKLLDLIKLEKEKLESINVNIINVLREFVYEATNVDKDNLIKIFLFGSYAKGNPHPGSDIDVCIVSSKLGKDFIDEYVKLSTVAGKIDDRIEPHPMSPADFAEKYNLLAHEVKTQGIPIIL